MTDAPKFTPGPWRLVTTPKPKRTNEFWYEIVAEGFNPSEDRDLYAAAEVFSSEADAHLMIAAPDMYAGGAAQTALLRQAQAILTQYLIPDGIDGPEAINQLLGLLDGPDQRSAQAAWDAALAKARGQA